MTATLFVKHKVSDYSNWKRGYDDSKSFRKESSVTVASVHRDVNDPMVIIVTHQFNDAGAMMAFANSAELKAAMAGAGVIGMPEIWFGEDLEHTDY
jgi:presenilin-like A22 family membrane protease